MILQFPRLPYSEDTYLVGLVVMVAAIFLFLFLCAETSRIKHREGENERKRDNGRATDNLWNHFSKPAFAFCCKWIRFGIRGGYLCDDKWQRPLLEPSSMTSMSVQPFLSSRPGPFYWAPFHSIPFDREARVRLLLQTHCANALNPDDTLERLVMLIWTPELQHTQVTLNCL